MSVEKLTSLNTQHMFYIFIYRSWRSYKIGYTSIPIQLVYVSEAANVTANGFFGDSYRCRGKVFYTCPEKPANIRTTKMTLYISRDDG